MEPFNRNQPKKTRMKQTIKQIAAIVSVALFLTAWRAAAQPGEVSVAAQPASVVKTVPAAGDTAVDPVLKEVSVTFSKDMKTNRMWSICQISKASFPESAGSIHYTDN